MFTSAYSLFRKSGNMASGLGMHSWKSGNGLLDCSSLNSGRVRLDHSHAHYFLLSKSSNLYRVSPPKKTTFKDYMAYAPVKEYKEQYERAWPPSLHTLQRRLSWPVALHLDYSGRGCVGLVFMSLHAARRAMAAAIFLTPSTT